MRACENRGVGIGWVAWLYALTKSDVLCVNELMTRNTIPMRPATSRYHAARPTARPPRTTIAEAMMISTAVMRNCHQWLAVIEPAAFVNHAVPVACPNVTRN